MYSPTLIHVDWTWFAEVVSRCEGKWSRIWGEMKDILEDPGAPAGFLEQIKSAMDFVNFGRVGGDLCSVYRDRAEITALLDFCGPLMGFAMADAPTRIDLSVDWPAVYAIMSPATVYDLVVSYDKIRFDLIEPLYNERLEMLRDDLRGGGDVSYTQFCHYVEFWYRVLQDTLAMKHGMICE